MIALGIELSSKQGSVALLKDGELLAEKSWIAERIRHGVLFQALENLLQDAHISYYDISFYAVGRGPGSFSGMRIAFAAAQALAMPSKTEVRAVSSGAALALAAAREGAEEIAVVGDARRGQVWVGMFSAVFAAAVPGGRGSGSASPAAVEQTEDWKLVPYEDISVPEGTVGVSPEAERLSEIFPTLGNPQFPRAKEVAELALMQTEPEPLEPLYMHPPVFVEPKTS